MALSDVPLLSGSSGLQGHLREFERDRFSFLARASREVDHVARMHFMSRDVLFVNSPEAIHEVLVDRAKSFEKAPVIRLVLYPLVGEGLFTSGGTLWRRQRRLMAPVFHHAKIDAFAPLMVDCARRTSERWQDGVVLDIAHETTAIAMSVAGRTLFGMDTFDEADTLGHALTVALSWASDMSISLPVTLQAEARMALLGLGDALPPLHEALGRLASHLEAPILWPTARNRELKQAIEVLDQRVQRMIDERRSSPDTHSDLLDHLLRARDEDDGGVMSDKQVRDEILTLFVAGHETTANGLAWSLYLLMRNPEAYARARAVVDGLGGRTPGLADLERLEYLGRVFKEALRLYPPVYVFARVSTGDVTVAGYSLPTRTIVFLSPWTVQRRADLWPDPLRFDPERFTPEAEAARHSDAWIPFSDGPRVCIGAHFAQLEAPLVLATLLQRADFELAGAADIVEDWSATLRPRGGISVRVKRKPNA